MSILIINKVMLILIDLIIKKGLKVSPYKPIETGCKKINNKLIPNDSKKFYKLVNKSIDIKLINPYRFQQPISPNRAIQLSKKKINIKDVFVSFALTCFYYRENYFG